MKPQRDARSTWPTWSARTRGRTLLRQARGSRRFGGFSAKRCRANTWMEVGDPHVVCGLSYSIFRSHSYFSLAWQRMTLTRQLP
jgi:hypothetical protein